MKKGAMILIVLGMIILTGCHSKGSDDSEITKAEAKQLILEKRSRDDGTIELISAVESDDKYIIHWEIDPIEEGKDSVDKQSAEIKRIESSVGTCKWR